MIIEKYSDSNVALIQKKLLPILSNQKMNAYLKEIATLCKINKELTYQIVAEAEADIKVGKISVNSPIGAGLLGRIIGDKAKIATPAGEMILEILEITA